MELAQPIGVPIFRHNDRNKVLILVKKFKIDCNNCTGCNVARLLKVLRLFVRAKGSVPGRVVCLGPKARKLI